MVGQMKTVQRSSRSICGKPNSHCGSRNDLGLGGRRIRHQMSDLVSRRLSSKMGQRIVEVWNRGERFRVMSHAT